MACFKPACKQITLHKLDPKARITRKVKFDTDMKWRRASNKRICEGEGIKIIKNAKTTSKMSKS